MQWHEASACVAHRSVVPHGDPQDVLISLLWLLGRSPIDSSHAVFGTHSFGGVPKQRASRCERSVPRTDSGQEHWRQFVLVRGFGA